MTVDINILCVILFQRLRLSIRQHEAMIYMSFNYYDKLLKLWSLVWKCLLSDGSHLSLRSSGMQNLSAVGKYPFLYFSIQIQIHSTVKTNKNTNINTR